MLRSCIICRGFLLKKGISAQGVLSPLHLVGVLKNGVRWIGLRDMVGVGIIFMLLSILGTQSTFAADEESIVLETAHAFYETYLSYYTSGTPREDELRYFEELLSGELASLLHDLSVTEDMYHEKTKGEVPPLVQGDLFTSLFEGATEFTVISCDIERFTASCLVELTNTEVGESPFFWQDRAYLMKQENTWVLDDVEFLGDWDFMHTGFLKPLITSILEGHQDL